MAWSGLVLVRNDQNIQSPDTRGAGYLWLSQCTVAPTAFWQRVFLGHPIGIPCNNLRVRGWGAGLPGGYSVIAEVNCKWQFVFTIYKLSMTGSALPKPPPFTQQGGEGGGDWARKAKSGLRQRKVNVPQPNHNFSENPCRSTLCMAVK